MTFHGENAFPDIQCRGSEKKTDVSDGSNYSFDLQSLFQEKIDSVFYFNGPRFSDEISSIIGYPGGECGATSTLQDTQSRIIIFSDGQISYFENFRITFCFTIVR